MRVTTIAIVSWLIAVGATPALAAEPPTLSGPPGRPSSGPRLRSVPESLERLFRGDMGAEIGIGCANPSGTTGGPNDWAVGVESHLGGLVHLSAVTYTVFTNVSPNQTSFTFAVWEDGGGRPAALYETVPDLPFASGDHTAYLGGIHLTFVPGPFFFGFRQLQTDVGMRLGLDTSSVDVDYVARSFIRAPVCGVDDFLAVDSIGFPGQWVMAAVLTDYPLPVELQAFDVE